MDCTGDGDIAAATGAPYEIGRPEDGLAQPMTLMFRMVDFLRPHFARVRRRAPGPVEGVHGRWDLIQEATDEGELDLPREDPLFFATPHPQELSVNSTRVTRALGISVWDLSHARPGRRRACPSGSTAGDRTVPLRDGRIRTDPVPGRETAATPTGGRG